MPSSPAPVQVGDLRTHPKGYNLRVACVYHYWGKAECVPEPRAYGRRTTHISIETVSGFPLVVEPELKPKPDSEPSP